MTSSSIYTHAEVAEVTRDMDLIRKIILRVQAKKNLELEVLKLDDVGEDLFGRHMEMLYDNGFVEGIHRETLEDNYKTIYVKDLSWEGHEFAGAIGKDDLWAKLKDAIGTKELARMPLKVVKDTSIAMAGAYLKAKLGL